MVQGILSIVLTLTAVAHAGIDPSHVPITHFLQVTPDIYRGARPTNEGLQALAEQGFKTDLDLENDAKAVAAEKKEAKAAGLNFLSFEMSAETTPDDSQVQQILAAVNDSSNYPIFVHCKLGDDRTGLIMALYRVEDQGWTPRAAYDEWVKDGFHTRLTALSDYFDEKTGTTAKFALVRARLATTPITIDGGNNNIPFTLTFGPSDEQPLLTCTDSSQWIDGPCDQAGDCSPGQMIPPQHNLSVSPYGTFQFDTLDDCTQTQNLFVQMGTGLIKSMKISLDAATYKVVSVDASR